MVRMNIEISAALAWWLALASETSLGWKSQVVAEGVQVPGGDGYHVSSSALGDQYSVAYPDAGAGVLMFASVPESSGGVLLSCAGVTVLMWLGVRQGRRQFPERLAGPRT